MTRPDTSDFTIATPAGAAGFVPALEGMRACAAVAVLLTHTAFQTGQVDGSVMGRVWGRFDMAVAVFFALSGFLLWRAHARAAWTSAPRPDTGRYYRSRLVRIMPAYLLVVVVALTLLPRGDAPAAATWLANLTLTQVFVPYALVNGLTQMWSLSVEMAFYLVMPLAAVLLMRLRGPRARWRIPVVLAVAALSLSWAWVGDLLALPRGVNHHNWLPAYIPWFAAGIVLAEAAFAPTDRYRTLRRLATRRICWPAAVLVFAVVATPLGGPVDLATSPTNWQFATRMALGGLLALLLLAPLVLAPQSTPPGRLGSGPMLALGRWSYGIFIWHLVVLSAMFPLFSMLPFNGKMLWVSALTIVFSAAVAALSYAWIEEPARRALARYEARRSAPAPRDAVIEEAEEEAAP
ncbi:acyltransferase [Tsukamurella strandjordii]|uniref:acyltransferase family protein n=1 Tax=Tsukamurella TaxID=2060 RepID=UPI001C7CE0F7|nr:acyltransferase [Tsukamurella sp. TY48]